MEQHEDSTPIKQDTTTMKQVARSTLTMSMATLVSRVTGFVRTWAMAFALGNTFLAAGFSLANNLPNMIYELVAGGVLSTAFLPIYLQQRNKGSRESANVYASSLLSIGVVILGIIALIASVFAPQFIATQTIFSSSTNSTVTAGIWLFRFFAFQIVFYGMSAIFSGLLNAERSYFWPAVSSIFMNVFSIITFFGYPFIASFGVTAAMTWLGVGTTASVLAMALVQIPALSRNGFRFRFSLDIHVEGLADTMRLVLPAVACTAINLVAISFRNSCALHVAPNGPASVSYAWMWYQFPYGVLGVALSTAFFTEMSDRKARNDLPGFKRHLNTGLRMTWTLIIPLAALLFACAQQLVGLYAAGKFTAADIAPVAGLLQGWAITLPLFAGYMYIYRAYSSIQDLKTVTLCNFFLTFVQVGLYLLFTGVIDTGGAFNIGLSGLAYSDSIFYALMLCILLIILKKRIGTFSLHELVIPLLKVSAASVIACLVSSGLTLLVANIVDMGTVTGSLIALLCTGVPGLIVVYLLCLAFGVKDATRATDHLLAKFKR